MQAHYDVLANRHVYGSAERFNKPCGVEVFCGIQFEKHGIKTRTTYAKRWQTRDKLPLKLK